MIATKLPALWKARNKHCSNSLLPKPLLLNKSISFLDAQN